MVALFGEKQSSLAIFMGEKISFPLFLCEGAFEFSCKDGRFWFDFLPFGAGRAILRTGIFAALCGGDFNVVKIHFFIYFSFEGFFLGS